MVVLQSLEEEAKNSPDSFRAPRLADALHPVQRVCVAVEIALLRYFVDQLGEQPRV